MSFNVLNIALAIVYAAMATLAVVNVVFLSRRPRKAGLPANPPVVSVIIPARNEAENLRRLIPTILSQSYPKLEVIVYDDGSEDETWDTATSFGDRRLTVMRGAGPPPGWVGKVHALYQASRIAHGDLFLFLDADTAFRHPEAVSDLVARFLALPSPFASETGKHNTGMGERLSTSSATLPSTKRRTPVLP